MTAQEYAMSLIDVPFAAVAFDIAGTAWRLIDSAGNFVGLATWEQLEESVLFAGEEGWIEGPDGLNIYAEGNVDAMRLALAAFRSA